MRRLKLDDRALQIWKVRPFDELINAFEAVRKVAVPRRPLGMITGMAGVGKTFAAEVFAANADGDVTIVTVPPRDILTPRILLNSIADALGMEHEAYLRKNELFEALGGVISERNVFLIIDEADRMHSSNADMLRELAETTGQPLCFLGCPSLECILARVPATHHRIGFRHHVMPVEQADIEEALINKALDPDGVRRIGQDTAQAIWECTKGNLRHTESLVHLLRGATRKDGTHVECTPAVVKQLNKRFLKAA